MSQVKWLIEPIFQDDIHTLVKGLDATGTEYKFANTENPFEYDWEKFDPKDCVVTYGSIQFGRFLQKNAKWVPGHWMNLPNYNCTKYYDIFRNHLLNYSEHFYLPFSEILQKKELIYQLIGIDDVFFIRPNTGDKAFTGKAVYRRDFAHRLYEIEMYISSSEQLCLISTPKNVVKEWRFFVVGGQVICGAPYIPEIRPIDLERSDDGAALGKALEALKCANGWEPDKAWCIDICETKSGNYYVLEINSFCSAGLCGADMELMVDTVNKVALEEWNEIYA